MANSDEAMRRNRSMISRVATVVLMFTVSTASADTVVLKDGTQLAGTVVIETSVKLVLKQASGNRIILLADIASVEKGALENSSVAEPRPTPEPTPGIRVFEHGMVGAGNATFPSQMGQGSPLNNSLVKVYGSVNEPDIRKPWTRMPSKEEMGSGIVVSGNRILTSAHLVRYADEIQIKANDSGDRISAHVFASDSALDLAILKLDDPSFFTTHKALYFDNLATNKGVVQIYGYPADATNASVEVVSVTHLEYAPYSLGTWGLHTRINSDVQQGFSGGVAMFGISPIGMADRYPTDYGSFSFIVPSEELGDFLKNSGSGKFKPRAECYAQVQKLNNPALRSYLHLDNSMHGVVVTKIGSDAEIPIRPWDVITAVTTGGRTDPVDDEGTVFLSDEARVPLFKDFELDANPTMFAVEVVRSGQIERHALRTEPRHPMLIPDLDGESPSYFVFGPIVFSAASKQLLSFLTISGVEPILSFRGSPLASRAADEPAFKGEQLVVVPAPFFPHKLSKGYGDPIMSVVKSVNGVAIRNLQHLVEVIRDAKDPFIVIEFAEKDSEILVFPREEMIAATEGILSDNNVRSQGSSDMMAVWNTK